MPTTSLFLLLAAVASLLACVSFPADVLIWLTLGLFAAFGCSVIWTLIRSVQK